MAETELEYWQRIAGQRAEQWYQATEEIKSLRELLRRYRTETPLGHQQRIAAKVRSMI